MAEHPQDAPPPSALLLLQAGVQHRTTAQLIRLIISLLPPPPLPTVQSLGRSDWGWVEVAEVTKSRIG